MRPLGMAERRDPDVISAPAAYILPVMSKTMLPLLALCAAILASCATEPSAESLAISNLKYGTMCGAPAFHVCTETADITLDGKGLCTFNHKEIPCNWYGFSFDYTPSEGSIEINCQTSTDYESDLGNPQSVVEKDSKGHNFEIALSGGRFVNPQYSGHDAFTGVRHLTETCFYRGRKLFGFTFNFRYAGAVT
jgi:hypothetical protein